MLKSGQFGVLGAEESRAGRGVGWGSMLVDQSGVRKESIHSCGGHCL